MVSTKFNLTLGLLILGMLFFYSCEKDANPTTPSQEEMEENPDLTNEETNRDLLDGERVVSIRLTDGPIDLNAVNIDIQGMYIVADNNRYQLSTVQGIYNLLDFQNGIDTLISVDTFNISFLKDIVFELGDNNTVVDKQGVIHPLELPSANRDFLVIKFNQRLDSLQLMDVQIDFDACKSVHETGNGRWILRPVVKVNRVNDRPRTDQVDSNVIDKVSMIKDAYPSYERFDIERQIFCFKDSPFIKVEMSSPTIDAEQVVLLDADCVEVYKVAKVDLEGLGDDLKEAALDAIDGNVDLFKKVETYTSSTTNEVMYGFIAIRGQGNSGRRITIYVDASGTVICSE